MKLILTFFLFPFVSIGQTIYKGTILSKSTVQVVPFATVGLILENIGTNADENGIFELKSNKSFPNDTLIITCMGYIVSKINVKDLNNSKNEIYLTEQSINLKEIVVSKKQKYNSEILNEFPKCSDSYNGTEGSITQLAQHFQTQNKRSQLTRVKICDGSIYHRKGGRYRLRIYSMDSITGAPLNDLYSQVIEVKSKGKFYTINLEKYEIIIPDNDFFIAVEWLKIPSNESKLSNSNNLFYLPFIGKVERTKHTLEFWQLNYLGRWIPNEQGTLLISVTVKN